MLLRMAIVLEKGRRSSILSYDTGDVTRMYHDTGKETPLPLTMDEQGVVRISGNRSLRSLSMKGEEQFRGLSCSTSSRSVSGNVPLHIRRALNTLLTSDPMWNNVKEYAASLGVKESTAWCYLCKIVELFPSANVSAAKVIYPPLLIALASVDNRGTLKQVMERLNCGPLKGSMEWKCIDNRFAHLRLARLCLMNN
jgi:hypothetical protein